MLKHNIISNTDGFISNTREDCKTCKIINKRESTMNVFANKLRIRNKITNEMTSALVNIMDYGLD
jgi:hypothetical protein